ncbi:MAG: hypothetical protein DVS81_10730 [Candidatus Accumulibacter meliphilus]|uniref:Uncharacterized protein n=1 Tax=Candidatus Accumulibacter meliphilus TaxID=2211374 RepID=A0A369XQ17_9PROT|nr:MAG: hypothetical protein DVS81_10730 [Candidatus Accumulibacter meliphilus]
MLASGAREMRPHGLSVQVADWHPLPTRARICNRWSNVGFKVSPGALELIVVGSRIKGGEFADCQSDIGGRIERRAIGESPAEKGRRVEPKPFND